jgi:uncharacterized protein (DUF1015 family)
VLFADHQVKILPYNRVILDLNGNTKAILLKRFSEVCTVEPSENSIPDKKGVVCFYIDRQWYRLEFKDEILNLNDPVDQLDVSLLQAFILKPIFGINDPRTDKRVQYVGGIRGTEELERLVNENRAKCAFSMHPTTISELMAVSDSSKIMPPKSTWFEPKLRDAMFIYLL